LPSDNGRRRPKSPSLDIYGGAGTNLQVAGALQFEVDTAKEALLLLEKGMVNRVTAATNCT
jgi:hypothetical protein